MDAEDEPGRIETLEFARLIAGRTDFVRHHTGHNEYARAGGWPTAEPDEPWIVMLQDRHGRYATLLFDLDDQHGDAISDAARLAELLDTVGIEYLVVRSGPGRRFHLLAPFRPGVPHELARALAEHLRPRFPALDISQMTNRSSAAARPPGSPHRLGGRSRLLDDDNQVWHAMAHRNRPEALLRLLSGLGADTDSFAGSFAFPSAGRPDSVPLSPRMTAMLRTGKKDWSDTSPSGVVRSVLVALVNAGVDRSAAARMVLDPANALVWRLAKGARRHRRTPSEHFDIEWEKAIEYCRTHPAIEGPNEARVAIATMRQSADRRQWKGRTAGTDRVVLEAFWAVASRCGRLRIRLGVREMAEMTGLSHSTICTSWKRLEKSGWLERLADAPRFETVEKHSSVRATAWRLRFSQCDHSSTRPPISGAEWSGSEKTIAETFHDAFVHMPNSVRRVWGQLSTTESVRPAQLAAATGMSSATIYRARDVLLRHGLAVWENGAMRAVATVNFKVVAENRGTLGHRDELHARHADERALYERRLNGEEPFPYETTVVDEVTGEIALIRLDPRSEAGPLRGSQSGVTLTLTAA